LPSSFGSNDLAVEIEHQNIAGGHDSGAIEREIR